MTIRDKKRLKFAVNAFIILGGAVAAILGFTPDEWVSEPTKFFLFQTGGVLAGSLKAIEKVLE